MLLALSLKKLPISDISGRVMALVPNGMIGELLKLLLSERFGLLRIGTLANGPLSKGGEFPNKIARQKNYFKLFIYWHKILFFILFNRDIYYCFEVKLTRTRFPQR